MKRLNIYKKEYLWLAALVLLSTAYYLLYFNNTFPYTEGWGIYYCELIRQGKVPYRDFYYYLPPLNLLLDYILWCLSGGLFIVYRFYRMLERLAMMVLIYKILVKYFDEHIVFIATFFGSVLGTAVVYDLMGDYNQTSEFAVVILIYFAIKYVECIDIRKKRRYLFILGLAISALIFLKQSSGVASGIVFTIVFCVYSWIEKNKHFIKEVGCVILGALIPAVLCALYLITNQALFPFVEQVFLNGSNAKGGLETILVKSIFSWFSSFKELGLFLAAAVIGLWISIDQQGKNNIEKEKRICLGGIVCVLPLVQWGIFYKSYAENAIAFAKEYGFLLIMVLGCVGGCYLLLTHMKWLSDNLRQTCTWVFLIVVVLAAVYCNIWNITIRLNQTDVFSYILNAVIFVTLLVLCGLVLTFLKLKRQGTIRNKIYIMLLAGALASLYAAKMAAGSSPTAARPLFIAVPIVYTILLSWGNKNKVIVRAKNMLLLFIGVGACALTFAQKYSCAYSWWGWEEEPYYKKTEVINVESMRGFRVSENQKKIYEEVVKLIEENSDEDSVVWGFPHMKIFNLLTNRIGDPGFIPVPFYDVCGDSYSISEAKLLYENEPDIVIWCDIPGCLETHEEMFRNVGKLGQREIIKWFYNAVEDERYEQIGQVGDLFVYRKDDGETASYQYFENKERENETLLNIGKEELKETDSNKQTEKISKVLKGKGTAKSPFLIENAEQLKKFSELVNEGVSFSGLYVKQTQNIDLLEYEDWEPIGEFDQGNYFYGYYDGAGYVIENLQTKGSKNKNENNGLFGQLGGIVANLGIKGGNVEGFCNGAIASHTVGDDAAILNCYTDVTVTGYRAGGIADNFRGKVENCFSVGELSGIKNANVISYGTSATMCNNVFIVKGSFSTEVELARINNEDIYYATNGYMKSTRLVTDLNNNIEAMQEELDEKGIKIKLRSWKSVEGGYPVLKK